MNRALGRKIRMVGIGAAAATALILLTLAGAFYTLQTNWFKNKVRASVIAAMEQASGGTVDLGSFHYDWRSLTAEFQNVIVHGTEPTSAQPLFHADSIRVGLKIVSFFKRKVDIASLVVDQPQFHLLIAANGGTNIPSPKLGRRSASQTIESLLNLKVRHFEFRNGIIETEARTVPLNARGDNVTVLLTYDGRGPRYQIQTKCRQLQVHAEGWPRIDAQVEVSAQIERDRLSIQRATFLSNGSSLAVSGTLRHFANPIADFQIASHLDAAGLAKISGLTGVRGGELALDGTVHSDESTPITFSGKLSGRNVMYRHGSRTLKDINFDSGVIANREEALFQRLSVSAAGAHISGEAAAEQYRAFRFDGMVSGLRVREAGPFLISEPMPWAGVASGHVHMEYALDPRADNFVLKSKLRIAPAGSGIPLSGDIDFTYRRSGNRFDFGSSQLNLPATRFSFAGSLGGSLQVAFDSTNLDDVRRIASLAAPALITTPLPVLAANGSAHFDGTVLGPLKNPQITGNVALAHFRAQEKTWDQLRVRIAIDAGQVEFSSATLDRATLHVSASGRIGLDRWSAGPASPLHLQAQFKGADLAQFNLPARAGIASGSINLNGSAIDPRGEAQATIDNLNLDGETLNQVRMAAKIAGQEIRVTRGEARAGPALLSFSGIYKHAPGNWREGDTSIKIDSNSFPIASLKPVRRYEPGLNAQFEIHAEAAAHIAPGLLRPEEANGTAVFRQVTVDNVPYGSMTFQAATRGQRLDANFSGDLRGSHVSGGAQVQLTPGNPAKGQVHLDRIDFSTLNAILRPGTTPRFPMEGFLAGGFSFEGPLQEPEKLRGTVKLDRFELTSNLPGSGEHNADLIFRNSSPVVFEAANGLANIRRFQIAGKDTSLTVTGSIPYMRRRPMDLRVTGSMDLRFFELLDANVQSSGLSLIAASVRGAWTDPAISGTVELKNGSFFFKGLPNALTALNGTLQFNGNRATIQKLTAQTGGGKLALSGFVSFGGMEPLVYRLEADAENVRVRYAGSIGVTANSHLGLTGTSKSSILSGTALVSRVVLNPNADVGNLLESLAAPSASPADEQDFLTGMQFDVHLESAPNLQFNTALSRDLQADIDLRLRGTPAHPILLGNISANQGDIRVFGAKYSINRGDVSFVDPVKIQPVLNLDLQTVVRGISVDITISGTPGKLNINYRSDPPLQPRDIIALLTVGRTPELGSTTAPAQLTNDITALQSSASTVLGQAISSSPNRLSKLFGVTNIRIDPMALQGISTTPQARLTVEQNVSRQITVTYVTNLSQTSEQIFRLEYAFSPQYSLVALRDDNGEFGIDIQYRKRFK